MATSIFPIPSASGGTQPAVSALIPTAYVVYEMTSPFAAGTYTINASPTTPVVNLRFSTGSSIALDVSTVTVEGTVSVVLGSDCTSVYVYSDTDAVTVSIEKTADAITPVGISGTLDTITSSGTYNQTGKLYVLAVGGGSGGGSNGSGQGYGSGGGGGGQLKTGGPFFVNAATTITIGTGGNADAAGGSTTFGNLVTATGGGGGAGGGAVSVNIGNAGGAGSASINNAKSMTNISNLTNGGGGAGGSSNQNSGYGPITGRDGGAGGGSGIGTGGKGGANNDASKGTDATGYGAGGGGGAGAYGYINGYGTTRYTGGGKGTAGLVYVLRGI